MGSGGSLMKLVRGILGGGFSGSEARSFQRFDIGNPRLAYAVLTSTGVKAAMADLSYGGIGLRLRDDAEVSWGGLPKRDVVTLEILGQRMDLPVSRAFASGALAGYKFHHKNPEGLEWLRQVLENVQRGASLRIENESDLDDRFVSGEWSVMSSEEGTVFRFRRGRDGALEKVEIMFEEGERHVQFLWSEGTCKTRQRMLRNEIGDRGIDTGRVEKPIVRQALAIMMGLQDKRLRKLMGPVQNSALAELGLASI